MACSYTNIGDAMCKECSTRLGEVKLLPPGGIRDALEEAHERLDKIGTRFNVPSDPPPHEPYMEYDPEAW